MDDAPKQDIAPDPAPGQGAWRRVAAPVALSASGRGSSTVRAESISPRQRASQVAGFFARDLLRRASADEDSLDRLSVRTGEEISETGQPTQTIEYRLDDRWSVFGEYDRFNQFNAGLKLRLYSR